MIARVERPADTAAFAFRLSGFDADALLVTGFDGTEGLSQLYEFRVRLCSERADIDPELTLGQAATLEIKGEFGPRYVHGIVRRFEIDEDGPGVTYYEACLVPPQWLLTRRITSRVFQKPRSGSTSVPGILSQVISDAGLPNDSLAFALSREYTEREFVVQYSESDWDFVSRLMEEEGIYYYFEHRADGVGLVVTDQKEIHMPFVDGDEETVAVPYCDPNGMMADRDFIYRVRLAGEMQIGSVTLDDFNFHRPDLELRVNSSGGRFGALSLTDYPGDYRKQAAGQLLADRRLEEQQAGARVAVMSSNVRQFFPGSTFVLTGHPSCDDEYLITAVTHKATQTQSTEGPSTGGAGLRYDAQVRVIPLAIQFRPPRVTPKSRVSGSQTAIVVGPPGEEIHTDEYGRVKVRFHWDQEARHDENASYWIRVSQGWAGGQYGMMFLPRVGQEVIVDFLEGDPDRPIITGRVFNEDHRPPYKLPGNKSISTIRTCTTPGAGGGNEVRFDDAKGDEQLLLYAQRAMHARSRGSSYESVGGNRHRRVRKNSYELVKEQKHSMVNLDLIEEINGGKHLTVGQDVKEFIDGKQHTYIAKQYNVLNGEGIWLGSDASITLWCKGNFIKLDESGVTIVGKTVKINSGGSTSIPMPDSPDVVEEPRSAATTEFGRNVRYDVEPQSPEPLDLDESAAPDGPAEPRIEKEKSWIEIELVDEAGQPVPNERYEITMPDGTTIATGSLDENGLARVAVSEPGTCQINFPALDAAAWERN